MKSITYSMKYFYAVFFLLAALVLSQFAHAGACIVTAETDNGTEGGSFRYKLAVIYNKQDGCYITSTYPDKNNGFDQVIWFQTEEMGGTNNVKTLTPSSQYNLKPLSPTVIGNYTDDSFYGSMFTSDGYPTDSNNDVKDYGYVVLDASGLSEGTHPFNCVSGSESVYLRSMVVITNGVSEEDFFAPECLNEFGGVKVCDASTHDYDSSKNPYTNDDWCKASSGSGNGTRPGGNWEFNPGDWDLSNMIKVYYKDADGDGYGDPDTKIVKFSKLGNTDAPEGYVSNNDDCDDTDSSIHPDAEEICDGIDNNCNDLIDNEDSTATELCEEDGDTETSCDDGIDNDNDGDLDCDDSDCSYTEICEEDGDTETSCDDGIDNDSDGDLDCDDSDCSYDSACIDDTETSCDDGIDNDDDGDLDCDDSDCDNDDACIITETETSCDDDIDNDDDGAFDCDDGDCATESICIDVDLDGYTPYDGDCDDNDATAYPDAIEICGDAIDNNCDGVIDEDDCTISTQTTTPAGGFEMTGGSGGCTCQLGAKRPPFMAQLPLMMLAFLPLMIALVLRRKAFRKE